MIKKISVMLLVVVMPFYVFSQEPAAKHNKHTTAHKHSTAVKVPEWAAAHNYDAKAHAYFPDFYTFYDPVCGGYLYWDNNNFTFSPTVPPFMANVDLKKTRVQVLKGLSLDLYPELNYPYYMKMYPPAENGNTLVPVPVPGNPAAH